MSRIRRYLLIALLLIIPIQGVAAAVHAFACGPDSSPAVASTEHSEHKHGHMIAGEHDGAHQHDQQSGKGAGDHPQHQCCHQVSAVPTVYVSPAPADLPVYLSYPSVLELTFVLEQPQRPPRA